MNSQDKVNKTVHYALGAEERTHTRRTKSRLSMLVKNGNMRLHTKTFTANATHARRLSLAVFNLVGRR